jgi:hypothetical protein
MAMRPIPRAGLKFRDFVKRMTVRGHACVSWEWGVGVHAVARAGRAGLG